jgi:two-component system sensor histidine kinase MtrB
VSSLFVRLSAAFAITAAIACLVIGLVVYEQTASGLFARARDKAAQDARSARDEAVSGRLPLGAQYNNPSAPARLVAAVKSVHVATMITGAGASERVWAGAYDPRGGAGVYVSDSLANQERELTTLRSTLVLGGLVAMAAAVLIGVALAAWLTSRLRRAAGTARRIASGELDQRVHLSGSDEVASLARAIDEMAEALGERITSERRFAAEAAHELRTPLASIVAASQLLPEGRPTTIVREGVAQLRRLVDQLLELARLESGLDAVKVDQVDVQTVARSAQRIYPSVLVDAPSSSLVATDLWRLERIIANLVENALRYGSPPVTIHVDGHTVAVSDHGPGFEAELIPHVTERFSVGDAARSQGVGLGLAITAEHARMLMARLDVANRPEGGAIVSVELVDLEAADGTRVS